MKSGQILRLAGAQAAYLTNISRMGMQDARYDVAKDPDLEVQRGSPR